MGRQAGAAAVLQTTLNPIVPKNGCKDCLRIFSRSDSLARHRNGRCLIMKANMKEPTEANTNSTLVITEVVEATEVAATEAVEVTEVAEAVEAVKANEVTAVEAAATESSDLLNYSNMVLEKIERIRLQMKQFQSGNNEAGDNPDEMQFGTHFGTHLEMHHGASLTPADISSAMLALKVLAGKPDVVEILQSICGKEA